MLTLRHLCKEYGALPSQVLAEDGGLMLQLMEVGAIVRQADDERAERMTEAGGGRHGW